MDAQTRAKEITKTSIIGILTNIMLVIFKAGVGFLANSIAIILDAVNNLTDVISSIITIIGVKIAKQQPDKEHPFGHGRVEYLSAIAISCLVLTAGILSLIESCKKIFNPEVPEYTVYSLIIVSVAILAKFLLGRYVSKKGNELNSDALVASGADASFDAIISASTLVGALITFTFGLNVDGYLGAIISLFIVKAGFGLFMEAISSVLGNRPDSETTKAIKAEIAAISGVYGAYDLILHNYGPDKAIGSVHIEVPDNISAEDIHQLTKQIQRQISEKFHVFLTVGIYAIDSTRTEERQKIKETAMKHPGVLGTHGIFFDRNKKFVSFDTAIDFTVTDEEKLRKELISEMQQFLPDYEISINYDYYYSD